MNTLSEQRQTYTIEQVLEYMDCSLCYHLKYHEKRIPPAGDWSSSKNFIYKDCMKETITYYYTGHMEKNPPTLKQLYDKFYSRWLERTGGIEENSILTRKLENARKDKRNELSSYVTKGYEAIRSFYETNASLKQAVLAVNHPYEIVFDNAIISGEFPIIREVVVKNKRKIELIDFSFSTRKPDESILQKNMSYSMMALAYRDVFQSDPDEFQVYFPARKESISLYRTANDYKRLFSIIEAFLRSVNRIDPFPRPGGHLGFSPYKELCDNYQFN